MGCFQALPEINSRGRQIGLNAGPAALGQAQPVESDYDVQWTNPLGRGHYGKVYRGWHKKTRRPVAIKVGSTQQAVRRTARVVPTTQLIIIQVLDRQKSRRDRLRREVEIQRRIGRHPDVVELLGVYETPSSVVLVMELMAGELFERIVSVGPYQEHGGSRVA
jgi:serine/threonine protein kinase